MPFDAGIAKSVKFTLAKRGVKATFLAFLGFDDVRVLCLKPKKHYL